MAASNPAGLAGLHPERDGVSLTRQLALFVQRLHSPDVSRDPDAFAGPSFREQTPDLAFEALVSGKD